GQHAPFAARQFFFEELQIEIEERSDLLVRDQFAMFLEDLMRDADVGPPRDFDSAQVAVVAKPLRGRTDDGPLSSRARRDERAVDVPKKKAFFSLCHSERSFATAKRSRGI